MKDWWCKHDCFSKNVFMDERCRKSSCRAEVDIDGASGSDVSSSDSRFCSSFSTFKSSRYDARIDSSRPFMFVQCRGRNQRLDNRWRWETDPTASVCAKWQEECHHHQGPRFQSQGVAPQLDPMLPSLPKTFESIWWLSLEGLSTTQWLSCEWPWVSLKNSNESLRGWHQWCIRFRWFINHHLTCDSVPHSLHSSHLAATQE